MKLTKSRRWEAGRIRASSTRHRLLTAKLHERRTRDFNSGNAVQLDELREGESENLYEDRSVRR